ncbi:SAM-dependent methyltransferase [Wenzhouxiangella sediminis]|uniref:Class I SAM-dependent methyltransferase n=1 Tax=Wenzhouxiangella sediminis TaxID=1792836 RepID=A0A3E1K6W3_9GAMM|nr:cyclopropane-fatty-acyl-phospholipid synthase family protein [Wenzhouxiangella sediminis]RFF29754.1 class I SAM-dependent methyltransferase [Wenzhouxiangella sediminis]
MTHTDRTIDEADVGSGGGLDRWLRARVLARLGSIEQGRLTIQDADGEYELGAVDDALQATVVIHDLRFWRLMASGGSVGAAEAWMAGLWDSPDPVAVVQVLSRNRRVLDRMERGAARLTNVLLGAWHAFNRNSLRGSRRNIAAHYDLGNEFFGSWLDARMMYSSALYTAEEQTLEQAQLNKLDRICRKLDLGPEDHLLEIGTGWGGLAIHAAEQYGCRVTTTTISREQFEFARRKVQEAGLEGRVTLLMRDYRDLEGRFDKVVSVEMIEAVGHQYLDTYLAKIDSLLVPDGLALIQAITIEDYRYASALRTVDFIKRYIFPGAFIPSVSAITASMARSSRLGLVELADFGASYATTLAAWRERFESRWDSIREMGFDETFRRRWLWYLAYCEGGFRERAISDVHLLMAGPDWRPPARHGLSGGRDLTA